MKRLLYTCLLIMSMSFIILSCKSSTSPVAPPENTDKPPNLPSNPLPHNGDTTAFRNSTLSWAGGDPNGDTVAYSVFVYLDKNLTQFYVGASGLRTTAYSFPQPLSFNTTYYWYVVSSDGRYSVNGPVWWYRTLQQANLKPYTGTGANNSCTYDPSTHLLTCTASIINDGGTTTGVGFRVGLYLSADSIITTDDFLLAAASLSSVDAGIGGTIGGPGFDLDDISLPAGTYHVGFFVDDQNSVTESNESDNTLVYPITIIYP